MVRDRLELATAASDVVIQSMRLWHSRPLGVLPKILGVR